MDIEFEDKQYVCLICQLELSHEAIVSNFSLLQQYVPAKDKDVWSVMPRCLGCTERWLRQNAAHARFNKDPTRVRESWDDSFKATAANYDVEARKKSPKARDE